jgi:hypothetical protein
VKYIGIVIIVIPCAIFPIKLLASIRRIADVFFIFFSITLANHHIIALAHYHISTLIIWASPALRAGRAIRFITFAAVGGFGGSAAIPLAKNAAFFPKKTYAHALRLQR